MFRSAREMNRCLITLLDGIRLGKLWTLDGPTAEAEQLLKDRGGYLSSGEAIYLRVACDISGGNSEVPFARLLEVLSTDHLERIFDLVLAVRIGGPAVDAWLAKYGQSA